MKRIILDANFLILPFQFNVHIFEELERLFGNNFKAFTLDRCLDEAKGLKKGKYHDSVQKLVQENNLEVIETSTPKQVDRLLEDYAEEGYIIATNDKGLKDKLKDKGFAYIYLRQKDHLVFSCR